ncbi:hypothetical protein NQ666_12510 [Acinetobacter baumannii]|uniref:hypothetical protein n=1 Tax=Acinetobacter calcoaceticus/baumannii complex TaxID=909768 RepID=UPI00109264FA|nr:hypothetical protein [Acinetobacter baumannii]MDC4454752.1 hypothetical protein [Acinetobacter baumannii]TGO93244.1 hypothetical protein E1953_13385 [Acinetobacter baumannii]
MNPIQTNKLTFLESFTNFVSANWFSIFSWVFGIALAIFLYYLQNKRANSAYLEQIKQAKKEIIDNLEGYIINELEVTKSLIENFKAGTERNYQIILDRNWTSIEILQDISFRLQTSRHLSVIQKMKYSRTLDDLISSFKNDHKIENFSENNTRLNDAIESLSKKIKENPEINIKKQIIDLLITQEQDRYDNYQQNRKKERQFEMIISSVSVSFILTMVVFKINESKVIDEIAQQTVKNISDISSLSFLLLLSFIIILTTCFALLLKIKKK